MNTIDKLKAAHAAATPGEWKWNGAPQCGYGWVDAPQGGLCTFGQPISILKSQYRRQAADAEFIALARNHMPNLLEAANTLVAIKALIDGEYDNPALVAKGPLSVTGYDDILTWVNEALTKLKGL